MAQNHPSILKNKLIAQPENRRLELKEIIKNPLGIAKTVVAFCNGAGGELYLGIKDKP
ncbi:MAG: ATP-binding protein, partial [Candidatus Cloacimonadota bacterium]|nr:ATP-binding protein [Candidatus Cloacimonadota bacterium]